MSVRARSRRWGLRGAPEAGAVLAAGTGGLGSGSPGASPQLRARGRQGPERQDQPFPRWQVQWPAGSHLGARRPPEAPGMFLPGQGWALPQPAPQPPRPPLPPICRHRPGPPPAPKAQELPPCPPTPSTRTPHPAPPHPPAGRRAQRPPQGAPAGASPTFTLALGGLGPHVTAPGGHRVWRAPPGPQPRAPLHLHLLPRQVLGCSLRGGKGNPDTEFGSRSCVLLKVQRVTLLL